MTLFWSSSMPDTITGRLCSSAAVAEEIAASFSPAVDALGAFASLSAAEDVEPAFILLGYGSSSLSGAVHDEDEGANEAELERKDERWARKRVHWPQTCGCVCSCSIQVKSGRPSRPKTGGGEWLILSLQCCRSRRPRRQCLTDTLASPIIFTSGSCALASARRSNVAATGPLLEFSKGTIPKVTS